MNIFKQLYCNQYYELKPKGKAASAMANGTGLVTVALALYALALYFILTLISHDFRDLVEDFLENVFGRSSGRTIGRIIAGVIFVVFYFLVKHTLGNKVNFEKTIAEFEALDESDQKKISKNGLIFFVSSIGVFVIGLVGFLILA